MGEKCIAKDLTGEVFGRWTIIKRTGSNKYGRAIWLCKCVCGKEKEISSLFLIGGRSTSCGCYKSEFSSKKHLIDLTGKRFGKWTIIRRVGSDKNGRAIWFCRCDCGVEKIVDSNHLRNGKSTSCGCYSREIHSIECGLFSKRQVYGFYKRNAKRRNIPFELSFNEFIELTQQNCYYCGIEPSNTHISKHNNGDFIYNGLDRKDNTKGYTLSNIVSCCDQCNWAKRDLPYEEFIVWINKLATYNGYTKIGGSKNETSKKIDGDSESTSGARYSCGRPWN